MASRKYNNLWVAYKLNRSGLFGYSPEKRKLKKTTNNVVSWYDHSESGS